MPLASPLRQWAWFRCGITRLSAGPAASVTNIGTTPSGYHLRRASPLSIQWFSSLTGHTSLHFDGFQVFARITFTLLSPRLGIFFSLSVPVSVRCGSAVSLSFLSNLHSLWYIVFLHHNTNLWGRTFQLATFHLWKGNRRERRGRGLLKWFNGFFLRHFQ